MVKEFDASPVQISIYTALRPLMALVAFYLAHFIIGKRERLIPTLITTGILCRLPFFLFPWIKSANAMIACAAFYLILSASGMPAWIEVLKINLSTETRSRLFSLGAVLGYLEGLILAICFGNLLNHEHGSWRLLFPLCSALGIGSLAWQARIPVRWKPYPNLTNSKKSLLHYLIDPCVRSINLLKKNHAFFRFQMGFMGCGSAVMLVYAIMPHYFIDVMKINYKDIALATAFFKAIGYAMSSSKWAKTLNDSSLFQTSFWIFLFVASFPLFLLIAADGNRLALWFAFLLYGIGLAGNHLIWHLSPTFFSGKEDSTPYTNTGTFMVGLRGLIFPLLGVTLGSMLGLKFVLFLAFCLSTVSAFYMRSVAKKTKINKAIQT